MKNIILFLTVLCLFFTSHSYAQDPPSQSVGVARLTPEVRSAISKGLEYLAKDDLQKADGSWGGSQNRVAETSLTLMAFMLQGHVPGRGQYGRAMENAISFLLNQGQNQRGYLGTSKNHAGMYEHGLAVLALSEAWGQSKNPRIKTALTRAVDVILRAQNREGGWRYSPEPRDADLSMTVMQLVALNSASEAGIAVPQTTIDKAAEYVISCQDLSSGGFKYTPGGGEPNFARTAAGVMSLIMCGQRDQKPTQRGIAFLKAFPESKFKSTNHFHYAHYYAVQAMYQSGDADFRAWYPKISTEIVAKQNKTDGSWSGSYGQAYGTSLSILILGVPYRYLPIYQR